MWVCAGVTRDWIYCPACEGLLYEWWKRGGSCWRPAYWNRVGIPGSGGKQWLRADVEYVLAFQSKPGPIPWADNKANGSPPKFGVGGAMSHRTQNGSRINGERIVDDEPTAKKNIATNRKANGDRKRSAYNGVDVANPGNILKIIVGGGVMGHALAHENEAPYPLELPRWFIRGWCPPNGIVCDPFSGSGTTVHAAHVEGRNGIGFDIRESQVELGRRRMADVMAQGVLFEAAAP